jgi:hypothetical protein
MVSIGEIKAVDGSLYDLRGNPDLNDQLRKFPVGPNGYDINFCINQKPGEKFNLVGRYTEAYNSLKLLLPIGYWLNNCYYSVL